MLWFQHEMYYENDKINFKQFNLVKSTLETYLLLVWKLLLLSSNQHSSSRWFYQATCLSCSAFSFSLWFWQKKALKIPNCRSTLSQRGLELDKLTSSERDMPRQVCTRINPISLNQNLHKISVIAQIKKLSSY